MTRRITALMGNRQRLDGGAMFGNAPRALWSRWMTPDDAHRVPLACRCLLIEDGDRRILCETGVGAFFPPAMRERYGVVESHHVLLDALADLGLGHQDIDVVVLSHLHFDHAGGLLDVWHPERAPALLFPRATFLVSQAAFDRACAPHPRDRASFIPELPDLLAQSERLQIVAPDDPCPLGAGYRLHFSDGHTPGLMMVEVEMPGGPILFAADLVPGTPWVHAPITMGYDRCPEQLIDEKTALLTDLDARQGRLFFTHDPDVAWSAISKDDRGRFTAVDPQPDLQRATR